AHLALFGYDPYEVYTGRGPFEAAGAGIEMNPGDIAFRVNYATVDDNLGVKDRRAGRIQDTRELEASLREIKLPGVEFIFKSTVAHRGVLVLRGKGLSHEVTDSDPHEVGAKVEGSKALTKGGEKTAKLLNQFSQKAWQALKEHPLNKKRAEEGLPPANYLLLRGCGVAPKLEPFNEKFGIRGSCVAAASLVKGVCRMAGMDVPEVPGVTGGLGTDLDAKREAVLKELENHDLVIMHIKGFDEAGHDGDHDGKVKLLERLDGTIGELMDRVDLIALLIDHTTPVSSGNHAGDPVPVVITGEGVRTDDVQSYDERSAAKGGLGHIRGRDVMPILANLMGKAEKFGA
ncbi:MAG: 2,3-bisphosphoglycerate-independent phosphoglycerate mutase, partial [Planctomycetes bacterium]|nr:2,3-bisphosphoglycerate-independent phosphoglycerate mutase [Planctomycetota bacterium]